MKNLLYFLSFLLLSCSDETPEPYVNTLAGYYRITSITTETPIDLNLDGIESTNYYDEITSPHFFNGVDKEGVIMADLNSYMFQAEIRPSKENIEFGNLAQFVDFRFPVQWVVRADKDDENSAVLQYSYEKGFNGYMYEFTNTNEIKLLNEPDNTDWIDGGNIEKMIQVDENYFVLEMNLNVFKYNEKRWVTTKATVLYTRYNEDKQ